MNSHHATSIFVLVCCWGGGDRIVRASIIDGNYYGPYHHRIGEAGYLYGTTGIYHREPLQHRNIGLIGSTTTAAVAMPRHNYNSGLHPYKNVIIPMSPYYWSPLKSGLLHRDNDYYRGRGSVSVLERRKQQLFGGLIPKKTTRKIVIGGPGGHVSQSFIGPNTHYGTAAFTVKH